MLSTGIADFPRLEEEWDRYAGYGDSNIIVINTEDVANYIDKAERVEAIRRLIPFESVSDSDDLTELKWLIDEPHAFNVAELTDLGANFVFECYR